MKKRFGPILAAALAASLPAEGGLFRAYLSSKGSDSDPCTVAAPCRLLPAALAAVADGGEVWMLDSANYNTGAVTIAKSVTILAVPSAVGSLVAPSSPAILVNGAGARVVLRNLSFSNIAGMPGNAGVVVTAASSLTVERCTFSKLGGSGISVNAPATVRVIDSTLRDNGSVALSLASGTRTTISGTTIAGHPLAGVWAYLATAGTMTTVDVIDSVLAGNGDGYRLLSATAGADARGSIVRTAVLDNATVGAAAQSVAGSSVVLSVAASHFAGNRTHLLANFPGSRLWVSATTLVDAATAFNGLQGVVESAGNNAMRNNAVDSTVPVPVVPLQ